MADVVGFAFLGVEVTLVGKRVFLRVVATTPNAMHSHKKAKPTTATMAFCVYIIAL